MGALNQETARIYGLSLKGTEDPMAFACSGFSKDFPVLELPQSFVDIEDFSLFKKQYKASSIYIADIIPASIVRCMHEQTASLKRDFVSRFAEIALSARERGAEFGSMDFDMDSIINSYDVMDSSRELMKKMAAAIYGSGLKINLSFSIHYDNPLLSEAVSLFMRDMMMPGFACVPDYFLSETRPDFDIENYLRHLRFDISALKLTVNSEEFINKNNIFPWIQAMDRLKIKAPLIFQPLFSSDEVFFRAVEKIRKTIKGELI